MKKIFVFALAAFLFGCAGATKWEPTLNTMPHKNQAAESKDLAECKDLAFQAAGYVKEGAEWTILSAAGGAAEGAVIGALVSGAGGAGVAAAAGAPSASSAPPSGEAKPPLARPVLFHSGHFLFNQQLNFRHCRSTTPYPRS